MASQTIQDYRLLDFDRLRRAELGPRSFDSIGAEIQDLKSVYDQMVSIVERNSDLPPGLQSLIEGTIRTFLSNIANPILVYEYAQDESVQFKRHNQIAQQVRTLHQQTFSTNQPNALLLYAAARSFDIAGAAEVLEKAATSERKFNDLAQQQEALLNMLRSKASSSTIQDYAEIFSQQALKHSAFSISLKKRPYVVIGAAYLWIATAVTLLVVGITQIHQLDVWFAIDPQNPYSAVAALIKRLAFISLWVYIISFGFRQFSINKHLATLNRHRANVLNSFRLFIETIGPDDQSSRSHLMLQVAKAIYEHGMTGYLHPRAPESRDPSFVELTRILTAKPS